MNNFIFISPQGIEDCIGQLMEDPYTLHHTQKLLKNTYQDIEFWTLEKNGKIIYNWGSEICVSLEDTEVPNLLEFLFKHENSDVFNFCAGIGNSLVESCKAANLAELQKGENVLYYSPELDNTLIDEEFESLFKGDEGEDAKHGLTVPGLELDNEQPQKKSSKQKVVEALMGIKKMAPQLAQVKQAAPEVFEAIRGMVDAMISMAEEKG